MKTNRVRERLEDGLENISEQIQDGLRKGQYTWEELQDSVRSRTRNAARVTDDFVHENSWPVIGAAVVIGVMIGCLMNRR